MSESAPAVDAGSAPRRTPPELTPETIEGVLADFRAWLQDAAASGAESPGAKGTPSDLPDLHTLLGQMTALRHEVNLQTKATRAQQEQNAEALSELRRALDQFDRPAAPNPAPEDDALRGVLKVLIDIADSLILARREFTRGRTALDAAVRAAAAPPPPASWLDRLLGRTPAPPVFDAARVASLLDSLVTGYSMSLQRVERALQQLGVERMQCAGAAFDPERMEAVEVIADSTRPAGQVVEEVRPGYLWRGRIFRFAQVTVTRA